MVRKAGITIYAALILGVMMTLIVACLTSAKMAAARAQIAVSAEVGLFSVFGEYDRQLLDEYEIFGLNCGGNEQAADLAAVCRECRSFAEEVLSQNSQHLRIGTVGLSGYRLLTDDGGEPFFSQAVNYEKKNDENRETLNLLQKLKGLSENSNQFIRNAENEEAEDWIPRFEAAVLEAENLSREAAQEFAGEIFEAGEGELFEPGEDELLASPPAEPEYNILENPVPIIKSILENGISYYLLPDTQVILAPGGGAGMLSQRTLLEGTGVTGASAGGDVPDAEMLFMCYIREKFGNYLRQGQDFPLYEMEYILERNAGDRENLERVIDRIFYYRMGLNLQEIDENEVYTAEIDYLTDRFCSLFRVPPDREIVQRTFRFCWAYGESLAEVSTLLAGGVISAEGGTDFIVPLVKMYELPTYLGKSLMLGEDGSYEDYLLMFLLSESKRKLLTGVMDCVENKIRSSGRQGFYLDHCLSDMELVMDVRANGRKTFIVTKAYGYE